jgi:hypothetical protein
MFLNPPIHVFSFRNAGNSSARKASAGGVVQVYTWGWGLGEEMSFSISRGARTGRAQGRVTAGQQSPFVSWDGLGEVCDGS